MPKLGKKALSTWGMLLCQRKEYIKNYKYDPLFTERLKEARSNPVGKLHHVRLTRSLIGKEEKFGKIANKLGLDVPNTVVILKNSAAVNNRLEMIKHLIEINPVRVMTLAPAEFDKLYGEPAPMFMADNGVIFIRQTPPPSDN